jgi:hypothetical protein
MQRKGCSFTCHKGIWRSHCVGYTRFFTSATVVGYGQFHASATFTRVRTEYETVGRHVDMPPHTIQHAKRMNVCCLITTPEDSNFNQ